MTKPHKWAKEIKAWADGAEIQVRYLTNSGEWSDWHASGQDNATWYNLTTYEYRVKPKPDVVGYIRATNPEGDAQGLSSYCTRFRAPKDNIKCIFDGETGVLKEVKVL